MAAKEVSGLTGHAKASGGGAVVKGREIALEHSHGAECQLSTELGIVDVLQLSLSMESHCRQKDSRGEICL